MRIIIRFRPISWMFKKNWYSTYRWTHPEDFWGETIYLIDFGVLTFGYSIKTKKSKSWL